MKVSTGAGAADSPLAWSGTLRRVGDRLRVTAQLLSVAEGVTRWAEHFDEDLMLFLRR